MPMNPSYSDLLLNPNWFYKRSVITQRDLLTCSKCQNETQKKASTRCELRQIFAPNQTLFVFSKESYLLRKIYRIRYDALKSSDLSGWASIDNKRLPAFDDIDIWSCEIPDEHFSQKESGIESSGSYISFIIDKNSGKFCFTRGLHVHHTYYQEGLMPWEYPNSSLETLCWQCHREFHAQHKVEWRDLEGTSKGLLTPCIRCHGAGYFPQFQYVENGICFRCHGAKFEEFIGL
jgi:hypothetical protein